MSGIVSLYELQRALGLLDNVGLEVHPPIAPKMRSGLADSMATDTETKYRLIM